AVEESAAQAVAADTADGLVVDKGRLADGGVATGRVEGCGEIGEAAAPGVAAAAALGPVAVEQAAADGARAAEAGGDAAADGQAVAGIDAAAGPAVGPNGLVAKELAAVDAGARQVAVGEHCSADALAAAAAA